MNFIEKIITGLGNGFKFIGNAIYSVIEFIALPLAYLYEFLIGIFYFISQVAYVIYEIIMIFVAFFQFFFAIISGLFRMIGSWVSYSPSDSYFMPSESMTGFQTLIQQIGGTGLLTVVPLVILALTWLYFVIKVIGTFGDKGGRSI